VEKQLMEKQKKYILNKSRSKFLLATAFPVPDFCFLLWIFTRTKSKFCVLSKIKEEKLEEFIIE
jgi:hypothetical protein